MNTKQNETMSWYQFLNLLKDKWISLLVAGVIGLISFLLVSIFLIPNKYNSTVDLLVNQKNTSNNGAEYNEQQADLQAINTYKDVLKKDVILEPVLKRVKNENNYQGNMDSLRSSINISNETDSQVLSITVSDNNRYVSADIANAIGDVFTRKIKKMMKIDNVTIVTKGVPSDSPAFPNRKLIALAGFFIGILIEILIISVRNFLDKTVKDTRFLTEELGLINLGTVYHIKDENKFNAVHVIEDEENRVNFRRKV